VSSLNSDGSVATTTINSSTSGPDAKAPAAGRYWDGLSSTDYYNRPPYIAAPPNPQIAVGPDDILTIVNRTIARYPNPNAGGAGLGTTVPNPYLNPPTDQAWLDVWLGIPVLGTQAGGAALCPSGTGSNVTCVIDNASIRYDQLQGRFVVLFTVTDMPAHRSNFVVIVSKFSQFTKCSSTTPAPVTCGTTGASSPLFTPPVIAPIVGGTQTGGINAANWVLYSFPINLAYRNTAGGTPTETALGTGLVSTPSLVATGGAIANFLSTPFCPGGGPTVGADGGGPIGGTARNCTNYFPTGARMGFDNDNLILTAPVVDQSFSPTEGTLASAPGQNMGPYAGTRVVTVPKLMLYNGTAFSTLAQPPACTASNPVACLAVNLADNTATGTVTTLGIVNPGPAQVPGCAVLNPPLGFCASTAVAASGVLLAGANVVPAIFFEPDNIRGRALASFDAQVAPFGTPTAGVITTLDYLVGTRISDNFGTRFINNGTTGTQYFLQPIAFSCPGLTIFSDPVPNCGTVSAGVVGDLSMLGPLLTGAFTQFAVSDPAGVGQGFSALSQTTNPLNTPVSATNNSRLFVGDSRPQQVMFREGLLYVARTVRSYDIGTINALNSSTVLYDLLKTCAAGGPTGTNGNSAPNCGAYSIIGGGLTNAMVALSGIWTNSTNVPDPSGNVPGFGDAGQWITAACVRRCVVCPDGTPRQFFLLSSRLVDYPRVPVPRTQALPTHLSAS
jgi:hypothetical protein